MHLGPRAQRRIAVVLADVFGEPLQVATHIAAFLDAYLRRVPLRAAFGLRAVIWGVTWLPLLFIGVPLPASALSHANRAKYLERWSGSPTYLLREGFYLLKAIALMGWGAHDSVRLRLDVGPLVAPRVAPRP